MIKTCEIKATARTKTIFMKWQEIEQYIYVCRALKSIAMSFSILQSYDIIHVEINSSAARLYIWLH